MTDGEGNGKWEDRTHFVSTEKTVLMEEQELTFSITDGIGYGNLPVHLDLVEGNTYTVVFDGVSYNCVCSLFAGEDLYIGNSKLLGGEDTGEPFLYIPVEGYLIVAYDANTSHTVGVYGAEKEVVHAIEEKYIPQNMRVQFTVDSTGAFGCNVTYGEMLEYLNRGLPIIGAMYAAKTDGSAVRVYQIASIWVSDNNIYIAFLTGDFTTGKVSSQTIIYRTDGTIIKYVDV